MSFGVSIPRCWPHLLLAACCALFFYRLGDRELWSSHEARAAQEAQRMLDDGDWRLPRLFDDQEDLQKPPLYYWLVAGVAKLRGEPVDGWAVRLPSAFAAVGCVLLVYVALLSKGRPLAALVAALVLATLQHFTWLARVGRIDVPLACAVTAAVVGLRGNRWGHLLGYFAVAVGVLLKGPIGAVLPALILRRGSRSLLWGVPMVLAVTLPWYVWVHDHTGGAFGREFFLKHNVNRFFGGDEADTPHAQAAHPVWFYIPALARDALPWTPVFAVAVVWFLRRGRTDADARFGLWWLAACVLLFSCARFKRADYLAPAYPGLAIFLGCVLERWWFEQSISRRRLAACGLAIMSLASICGWTVYLALLQPRQERDIRPFAELVRQHARPPQVVLFFRAESHTLAYRLGRPLNTFREWENLDIWAGRPGPLYIIMPADAAAEWPLHVSSGLLEEVARQELPGGRTVVLMRTRPKPSPP